MHVTTALTESVWPCEQVTVVDPCRPQQVMCRELQVCSVLDQSCDPAVVGLFGDAKKREAFVPQLDETPPILRHRANCTEPVCRLAISLTGMVTHVYNVSVGESFSDPGTVAAPHPSLVFSTASHTHTHTHTHTHISASRVFLLIASPNTTAPPWLPCQVWRPLTQRMAT